MNAQEIYNATFRFFKTYWIASLIVLIFVVLVLAWVAGYRVSSGLTVVRVGTLEVSPLPPGAAVFIDQASRGVSTTGSLYLPLVPGTHSIIVSMDGFQPWETIATVTASKTTVIDPLLFPVRANVTPLNDAESVEAKAAFAAEKIPTDTAPLILGCAAVSVHNNQIVASVATSTGCTPPEFLCAGGSCGTTIVYSPANPVRAVFAYPRHTDALIVLAGDTLYAIGLDPRSPQAFAPLLAAPGMKAAPLPDGRVVAQNSTGLYGLGL